ncbi:MAG: helix-turn-helix domain-containing protein [Acidobacteria bacterium]|nr:helix-turn-helix domain-containing protein [Acidobacteriota bacterium]
MAVAQSPRRDSQLGDTSTDVGVDLSLLARMVRAKREKANLSMRGAAQAAGVSFSTISRIESGAQPDLTNFLNVCAWLGVDPSRFTGRTTVRQEASFENVIQHLSADPRLTSEAAEKIARMVGDMYEALAKPDATPVVAAHMRAASVLRPGVPERLANLIQDMHQQLERLVHRDGTSKRLQS